MRKRRKRAIISSICKQVGKNIDKSGFWLNWLSHIDEFRKKNK